MEGSSNHSDNLLRRVLRRKGFCVSRRAPAKKEKALPRLRFDFNAAVRKVKRDHPELKSNSVYIDAANDNWQEIEELLDNLAVDEEDIQSVLKTFKDAKRLKTSFHIAVTRGGVEEPFSAIVFHPDKFPLYGAERGLVDDVGTFDHETGHALTPDLDGTPAENIADAYASLRHLQRMEGETESLDYCAWKRAYIFVTTGISTHLTTFTVDKIICDAKTADFMSLTPRETAAIAKAYAKKNTPADEEIEDMKRLFKPLKGLEPKEAFRKLARITLKQDDDTAAFYLGMRVLQGALKNHGVWVDGGDIALKGREWDSLRGKVEARINGLPKDHPLRRIV